MKVDLFAECYVLEWCAEQKALEARQKVASGERASRRHWNNRIKLPSPNGATEQGRYRDLKVD